MGVKLSLRRIAVSMFASILLGTLIVLFLSWGFAVISTLGMELGETSIFGILFSPSMVRTLRLVALLAFPGASIGTLAAFSLHTFIRKLVVKNRWGSALVGGGIGFLACVVGTAIFATVRIVQLKGPEGMAGGFFAILAGCFLIVLSGTVSGFIYGLLFSKRTQDISPN